MQQIFVSLVAEERGMDFSELFELESILLFKEPSRGATNYYYFNSN
jgi:hypothetical protein